MYVPVINYKLMTTVPLSHTYQYVCLRFPLTFINITKLLTIGILVGVYLAIIPNLIHHFSFIIFFFQSVIRPLFLNIPFDYIFKLGIFVK